MAAPGNDPNKIDVSLNIMSDATLAAVNNLTSQLSGLREFLAAQSFAQQPGQQAEAAGRWVPQSGGLAYIRPGETQAGIFHGPSGPIQTGDPSNPSQGSQTSKQRRDQLKAEYEQYMEQVKDHNVTPQRPSPEAEQLMASRLSDAQRWKLAGEEKANPNLPNVTSRLDRFFSLYQGIQRDPGEDRTFEQLSGGRRGESALPEGMGYPSQGPSTTSPMAQYGDMPGWAQTLQREGITPESRFGLTIPRLGEFTIQDKLNMAAQWMGRAAIRAEDDGRERVGGIPTQVMGRTAAGAAYLRDQSAALVEVGREFQRLRGFAQAEELTGEQLGYSRESALGDTELFGIGFRNNLGFTSAAQREAIRQEITQRRVQAAPGVSGEEAQRIRSVVAGMGYSGNLNQNLQLDLFKPLQQRGIAPESVAPLIDQGVRQGNMSMASLRDTMIQLADAARNANMTLEETTSSALEYSEAVQAVGANYEDSLRNAATFTRSGLDPRIASEAMQSPMVQGILTAQTGLAPGMQGVVSAGGVMRGMQTAAQQALAMGAVYRNMPDATITTASGERITTATGSDAQLAFASQVSGIPRQILERMQRNPNFLAAGGDAQEMVGRMREQVQAQRTRERTIPGHYEVNDPAEGGPMRIPGRGGPRGHTYVPERTETYEAGLTDDQRQALEHGRTGDNVVQYDELERQMIAMDPKNRKWTDRVRKIRRDHGDVEERLSVAQRIIGETVNVTAEPDYVVGLTDEARKILKIEKPKDRTGALPRANAGGAPANSGALGPNFNSATGGAMSYGRPGP